jgi:TolA-binding protein
MKKVERERLKHNEAADAVAAASLFVAAHGRSLLLGGVALVVLAAAVLGYLAWRERTEERAQAMLAAAVDTAAQPVQQADLLLDEGAEAPVFATEAERLEAVIGQLMATADAYPSTDAGIQARYYAASLLADANRLDAAAGAFEDVRERAGRSITGRMATLGLASVQVRAGNYEPAIRTFEELASGGGDLPVDGVLMHLADAYVHAGRQTEAVEALRRIVNEFPQSPYASEARQRADTLQADIAKAS